MKGSKRGEDVRIPSLSSGDFGLLSEMRALGRGSGAPNEIGPDVQFLMGRLENCGLLEERSGRQQWGGRSGKSSEWEVPTADARSRIGLGRLSSPKLTPLPAPTPFLHEAENTQSGKKQKSPATATPTTSTTLKKGIKSTAAAFGRLSLNSASEQNFKLTRPRSTNLRPTASLYLPTVSSVRKEVPKAQFTVPPVDSPVKGTKPNSKSKKIDKMGDSAATGGAGGGMKELFASFSRFGDTASDGKQITLTNSDKWMKQAGVIDGKKITTTDTSIAFKKLFKTAKKVSYSDYNKFLESLAASKKMETKELTDKMTACGAPGLSQATKAAHVGVVERLTDTSKYTGSHKERFDASGKGRGIEGRKDVAPGSGYVQGFKKEAPPAK